MSHSMFARILVLLGIWIIALLPLFFMTGPEPSQPGSSFTHVSSPH